MLEVDLRNRWIAGVLAWLLPGAGHFYQRRFAKGGLFCVCILGTFFFGLAIGGGHVVYASLARNDIRWQYFCQVGVGLPALPALAQNRQIRAGKPPLLGWDFMTPPQEVLPNDFDELASWHEQYHTYYELGTLYTMIAGLLNILVIYDAVAGPFLPISEAESQAQPKRGPPGRGGGGDKPQPAKST
jgi:hypothetical protein